MISLIYADLVSQIPTTEVSTEKAMLSGTDKAELRLSSVATATGLFSLKSDIEPITMLGSTLKRYVPEASRHYPMATDQMDMELLDWVTGVDTSLKSMPTQILLPFVLSLRKKGANWLSLSDIIVTYAKSDEVAHDILAMMRITSVVEESTVNIEVPTKVEKICETLFDEVLMDAVYVAYDALCSPCFKDAMIYLKEQESVHALYLGLYWYELVFGVDVNLSLALMDKIRKSHPTLGGILEEYYRENPPKVSQRKTENGLVSQLKGLMHF